MVRHVKQHECSWATYMQADKKDDLDELEEGSEYQLPQNRANEQVS